MPSTLNKSEQLVADTLDRLHVRWEYEPRLFELEHDEEGRCKRGFRPDFYLPDHDLYIEVTWARQTYTTDKRSRARLLRARYPGVRLAILYRRDFVDIRSRLLELLK